MTLKIIFSANEENEECNHQKPNTAVDNNSANISEIVSPRNFNSILSRRLLSPDSALATSRDDDNGSSLSSTSADEMGKLYEQVLLEIEVSVSILFGKRDPYGSPLVILYPNKFYLN